MLDAVASLRRSPKSNLLIWIIPSTPAAERVRAWISRHDNVPVRLIGPELDSGKSGDGTAVQEPLAIRRDRDISQCRRRSRTRTGWPDLQSRSAITPTLNSSGPVIPLSYNSTTRVASACFSDSHSGSLPICKAR
jgi:hypothetical protein